MAVELSTNLEKQNQAPNPVCSSSLFSVTAQDTIICSSIQLSTEKSLSHKTIAQNEPAQVQLMPWPVALKQPKPESNASLFFIYSQQRADRVRQNKSAHQQSATSLIRSSSGSLWISGATYRQRWPAPKYLMFPEKKCCVESETECYQTKSCNTNHIIHSKQYAHYSTADIWGMVVTESVSSSLPITDATYSSIL